MAEDSIDHLVSLLVEELHLEMPNEDNVGRCPIAYYVYMAGHPRAVLSEEGYHLRLVRSRVEVGSEASSEGVSREGDMLGEVWSCEAALRDEGRIDL